MIRESIDEALVAEWQRHWRSANTGRTLFALLDRAGEPWMPEDARCCRRMKMVLVARYMVGHCHLGPFGIPREDELEDCPLCGDLYLEDHFIYDCAALRDVPGRWLDVGSRNRGLAGVSVAAVLLVGDLSSCRAGAACSFGGLLVVGLSISPCG